MSEVKEQEEDRKPVVEYEKRSKKYSLPRLPMPKSFENMKPIQIYQLGREHGEQRVIDFLEFAERMVRMKRWFYLAIVAMNAVYVGVIIYLAVQLSMIPILYNLVPK